MKFEIMRDITQSVLHEIDTLRQSKDKLLIAIDGRCAAGKSTLASHLQEACKCNVIHIDHFFLRPEQRMAERLNEPGGNVDYERFQKEVLIPLKHGEAFTYRPYDCRKQEMAEAIRNEPHSVSIIEGSYSCHPALKDYYDLRIFLSVDPQEQLRRIRLRNGDAGVTDFESKWIPLEERYFLSCHVQEHNDLTYKS